MAQNISRFPLRWQALLVEGDLASLCRALRGLSSRASSCSPASFRASLCRASSCSPASLCRAGSCRSASTGGPLGNLPKFPLICKYNEKVRKGTLSEDFLQKRALSELEKLCMEISGYSLSRTALGKFLNPPPRGAYIHGNVGCGKTMIMDMFYEAAPTNSKMRIHFHEFMQKMHLELYKMRGLKNPVSVYAENLLSASWLICFDELQVTNIADAMILRSLFFEIISKGGILVVTSNRHPNDLYANGAQRENFLPAIRLILTKMNVYFMEAKKDYRTRNAKNTANNYFWPLTSASNAKMREAFQAYAKEIVEVREICSKGRTIRVNASGNVAAINFSELCERELGASDYLKLLDAFSVVFISNVPKMGRDLRNEARRFITFIDAAYDKKTKIFMSLEASIENLFIYDGVNVSEEEFAYKRIVSRLTEMGTTQWINRGNYGK